MTIRTTLAATAAGAALVASAAQATAAPVAPAPSPTAAVAQVRTHFDATVIARTTSPRTFLARTSQRGITRFRVTSATRFERVTFAGLRRGRVVEVEAVRRNGRWVATEVESSGRGGNDDGRGRNGSDDGPNHS